MGKKKPEDSGNLGDSVTPTKRQRGKVSLAQLLAPFLPKLSKWAEDDYQQTRFNKDAPDEEVRSADKLRQVLADLGGPVATGGGKS